MSFLSSMSARTLHLASQQLSKKGNHDFQQACKRVQDTQLTIFRDLLKSIKGTRTAIQYDLGTDSSLADFQKHVPVSDYDDWHDLIERQQNGEQKLLSNIACERYQPTSGSTSTIKWVPYNQAFLDELDHAIGPWMADLYAQFPEIKQGKHYWSLSWVPSDLRNKLTSSVNDDLQLLPWWKRLFMSGTMAVPESVSLAKTSEESSLATACYLVACRELSFISVWSPTFALSFLQLIKDNKTFIENVLEQGAWPDSHSGLAYLRAPQNSKASQILKAWDGEINAEFTKRLWPNLKLISAWDTSSSKIWAQKLQDLFAHCRFQGKGLWATEGVITIPYEGKYPLAITSHFYEFEDLQSHKIYLSWQLEIGQNVRPIISTANGLLRYAMKDQLKVTGFIGKCPCLEFIGRLSGVDMVGEKLSPEIAVSIINDFSKYGSILPISLLAIPNVKDGELPHYVLLCERQNDERQSQKQAQSERKDTERDSHVYHGALNHELEESLLQSFHYKLARELGQLGHAYVLLKEDAMEVYTAHKIAKGMVAGNIKIEPLVLWQHALSAVTENAAQNLDKFAECDLDRQVESGAERREENGIDSEQTSKTFEVSS